MAFEVVLSTEIEVKIRIESVSAFDRQVLGLDPKVLTRRHFEDNFLMDFPEKKITSGRRILRIRLTEERALLTYKGPPKEDAIFKVREEIETGLEDGRNAVKILQNLGLKVWFRYQKYRREYAVDNVVIAIDETPIGNYAELEGETDGIYRLARALKIEKSEFMRYSYYDLYLEDCRLQSIPPENMVF